MPLINEVELGLVSPKMGRKVPYPTLMSIRSIKRVSKRVILCGKYCNIKKYYCLLLKLMPKVSGIYISLVIYAGNYRFRVFGPCTGFWIKSLTVNSL